jgi:hypothetical protein
VHLLPEPEHKQQREAALDRAGKIVCKLKEFPEYPWIGEHRAQYYEMMTDEKGVNDALSRPAAGFKNNPAIFAYAANMWRRGEKASVILNVLKESNDIDNLEVDRLLAFVSAQDHPLEKEGIKDLVNEWTDKKKYLPDDVLIGLLMLGAKEDAQRIAAKMDPPKWPVTPERKKYDEQYKAYASAVAAKPSEKADAPLINAAQWSRTCKCSAHFLIGLRYRAHNDEVGAMKHFKLAVETNDYFSNDFILSRAILERPKK